MLCLIVWVFCAATIVESFWVLGVHGWRYAVLPLVASTVVWALLWMPRVVVRPERLEVRNVLITHVVPYALIEDVRLGAMLRIVLAPRVEGGTPEVLTAWNAPGVGKDRPLDRVARGGVRRSPREAAGLERASWSERLVRDQRSSPSAAVVEAWRRNADHAGSGADAEVTRHLNVEVMCAVGASMLLLLVRVLS
ncbi:MAG TPA: PH domain-containing protein [Brachybacterium faecium]|nr:PH domain-containing protein [Brachybacterium faecium]HJG53482.1 PH domain-containing protein [Brachybacterium faecium]